MRGEFSNVIQLVPRTAPADAPERVARATVTRAVYTVAEVADMLSLSLGGTYTLVRTGEIPARKLGGRWVIPIRAFEAWLNNLPAVTPEPSYERDRYGA